MDMKYKFDYQIIAFDLWKLSMHVTYGSIVGASNIVFTIAMILVTARFWNEVNIMLKLLMIFGISLFTVIQPLAIYLRAKKHLENVPEGMEIGFDDKGVHIQTSEQNSDIKWNTIKKIINKTNMIILFTTSKYGLIITNKMLGSKKEEFYKYLISEVKK